MWIEWLLIGLVFGFGFGLPFGFFIGVIAHIAGRHREAERRPRGTHVEMKNIGGFSDVHIV